MYSSRSSQVSSRKTHNDRNQQILKALLKEPANKTCADCKTATHPRWASWNLGCFICIRCSGIHRSMGTHISRVKSVDLDSWTDEQVKSMVGWGNAKLNWFWEDGLPENYIPDDSKIENFIRTKYDKKKWAKSGSVPDPSQIPVGQQQKPQTEQSVAATPTPTNHRSTQRQVSMEKPVPATPLLSSNLLDFDIGSSTMTPTDSNSSASIISQPTQPPQQQLTQSLPNLQSLLSAPQQQQQQQPQQQQQLNSRPDLKKSILSLYSTPTSSQQNFYPPQRQPQQQQMPYQSIVNSVSQIPAQAQLNPALAVNNPWNSTSTTTSTATNSKSSLDDDLFKNVWS